MNHPSPKSVTTIREFLALIEKAAGTAEHFGFRGQKNRSWNLECGAYRRLRDFDNLNSSRGSDLQEKFLQYHRDRLIRPARNYNFDTRAGREIGDLEVLAKLQHSGAATCLLDFTRNALVALWIACESDEQEGSEVDGKVFVVELSDRSRFREASQNDAREKDNVSRFLSARDDPRSVLSWYWEPPMVDDIATRTLRQHSIFVFGQPVLSEELAYTVIVSGKAKKDILKELESRHNLSSETLFQDLSGFCSANSQTSPLREVGTSSTYYSQGTTAYGQSNFEAAVMEFTEGLCLRPDRADLYLGRAHARTSLAQPSRDSSIYEQAIEDYGAAIGCIGQVPRSHFDMVSRAISLHNRGNVRVCVHDYDGAIKDYGEYIEFEENAGEYGGTPFYNRGNTFALTKQWDRAISDYMKAIDRNECSHDSHYNLANIFVIVEQYDAALVHYDEAVRVKPDFENALRNRSTTRALAGQLEEAMQGFTEYGSVGNNCALVSSALNGTKVSGNLTLIGNTGNTGNISLAALRGPGGGKGFSGSKAFAKRFVWSGTEGVCGQE